MGRGADSKRSKNPLNLDVTVPGTRGQRVCRTAHLLAHRYTGDVSVMFR